MLSQGLCVHVMCRRLLQGEPCRGACSRVELTRQHRPRGAAGTRHGDRGTVAGSRDGPGQTPQQTEKDWQETYVGAC